jgi:hypothetical protein
MNSIWKMPYCREIQGKEEEEEEEEMAWYVGRRLLGN